MRLHQATAVIIAITLFLVACNLAGNSSPVNGPQAVFTAAAQTLEAQLTEATFPDSTDTPSLTQAILPGSTDTPGLTTDVLPTLTALASDTPPAGAATPLDVTPGPTQACDAARFVTDVTIPDGTIMSGSQSFTKTWRFINTGNCAWNSSYSLVFDTGDQMGGPASIPLTGNVAPGQQTDLSLNLQAPATSGSYRGYWRLRNSSGVFLPIANGYKSKSFYVDIRVKESGKNPAFTVTDVAFSVSHAGTCSSGTYTVTAKVTTNAAGDVAYTWERSDGVSGPLSTGSLSFPSAQTQSISYDWASGATGLSMTLYIDSPNHQNFGTALLNCP